MWAGFEETNKGQCRPLGAMTPGIVTTSTSEGLVDTVVTQLTEELLGEDSLMEVVAAGRGLKPMTATCQGGVEGVNPFDFILFPLSALPPVPLHGQTQSEARGHEAH